LVLLVFKNVRHYSKMTDHQAQDISSLTFYTRLAEDTERYNDMFECILKIVDINPKLANETRNSLSVALKNIIGPKRASLVVMNSIEGRNPSGDKKLEAIHNMTEKIRSEIRKICDDVQTLIDWKLLPNVSSEDHSEEVFFYKMKGDYFRYKAETCLESEKSIVARKSFESYEKALEISTKYLSPANCIHLGLVLNFSVLKYEILHELKDAIDLASKHFSYAVDQIDELSQTSYKDSTIVLQLLRDNVSLWQSHDDSEEQDEQDEQDNQIVDQFTEKQKVKAIQTHITKEKPEIHVKMNSLPTLENNI